ncbi:MAG: SMC-Scp complex subunit ScpB [Spirochaetales bacterium]|nr:SMC-Scp complex subunit ScpB [Spirochaetales bacterium]
MEFTNEARLIESILFLEGEPVDIKSLSRITKLSNDIVLKAIITLQDEYKQNKHGIELLEIGGGFAFSPKKELWPLLQDRYGKKSEYKLSRAAMETLSIIAYSQPITRTEVESLRGVSADGMIKLLLSKSLIKEVGRKDVPGKPTQYGTTREFLKLFRLKSIADLPKLEELESERFEEPGEAKQDPENE